MKDQHLAEHVKQVQVAVCKELVARVIGRHCHRDARTAYPTLRQPLYAYCALQEACYLA